jgi:septum formation protein
MHIILASTSQYRKQLLEHIGLEVQCIGSNVDEEPILGKNPIETSQLRAREKARSVATKLFDDQEWKDRIVGRDHLDRGTQSIVIGADQVVYIGGECFGKPKDEQEWKTRLQKFSGRSHQLTTSVSLWNCGIGEENPKEISIFSEHTTIFFRELQPSEIEHYVEIGEAKNCAGGYMIEGVGSSLIERIEGDYQNVIGLPIFPLLKELRALGAHVLNQS